MGSKRPFDGEELPKLPFKLLRQLETDEKLTSFPSIVSHNDGSQKHDILGEEGGLCKSECAEALEGDAVAEVSYITCKELETSTPMSWVSRSPSEDDALHGAAAHSSLFSEYFESNITRRVVQFDNMYSSYLDQFPRKQVPIGPDNQALIPELSPLKFETKDWPDSDDHKLSSNTMGLNHVYDNDGMENLLGTCVIPMPVSELTDNNCSEVGDGRKNCSCLDKGSVRCVRQHIREAREKLMKTLGEDKFIELGFLDMGEEVAHKWSDEEEHIFHEVVYGNPASLGKNFWVHLSNTFPSRTMGELVSYYFNVFMLRKRAAQNRYDSLDIDSDDDEWHGGNLDCFQVGFAEEDEDSVVESPIDQDNEDDDEDSSEDGDGDEADDARDDRESAADKENDDRYYMSEANLGLLHKGDCFVPVSRQGDKILGSVGNNFDVKDDSCLSFECQPNLANSTSPAEAGTVVMTESGQKSIKCCSVNNNGLNNGVGPGYMIDPCDAGVWDASYLVGHDLLPTSNMIEEIFGPGSWDEKSTKDESVNKLLP